MSEAVHADAGTPGPGGHRDPVPLRHYSTADLPPNERYSAWLARDWPRSGLIFRTEPTEPFNTTWESAQLGSVTFIYTEITGARWERRLQDIRDSDLDAFVISMMINGLAHGDADGRAFRETSGTLHFHDLSRPSLHVSTASLTYNLMIPRPVMVEWFGPLQDLHGLVVEEQAAALLFAYAAEVRRALSRLDASHADRLARVFLELASLAAAEARPDSSMRVSAEEALRRRGMEEIELRLGDGPISVPELCRILEVPRRRLFAAFRSDGGVNAYVMTARLQRARDALFDLEKSEPIGGIAHRLGFSDAAHLSRAFRQRYGMSPREYRRLVATDAGRLPPDGQAARSSKNE